jgi:trehalose-phosphatase
MKYLMDFLDDVKVKLEKQKTALLLDYDGTLTPIVNTPDEAILNEDMRSVLSNLKDNTNFIVAVFSGRSLLDVRSKVELDGICYTGNHGMEIEFLGMIYIHPEAKKMVKIIQNVCSKLQPLLSDIDGTIIEDKGLTASVHYRMSPPKEIPKVKRIVESTIEPYVENGDIKLTHGKMVLEIRPNIQWDKGKAVEWVLSSIGAGESTKYFPIYIGDDRTDEDAFKVLRKRGITILVSSNIKKTNAEFLLYNVEEVKNFLHWLGGVNKNTVEIDT